MATTPATTERERVRRMRIRLAALRRHAQAKGVDGKSELAVAAGKQSGRARAGDSAFGLDLALKRWHPAKGNGRNGGKVEELDKEPKRH